MDINRATIVGRLTRDPEVRTTTSGRSVTSFSVATNFAWKDQSGEKKESVEFHNVVAWQKLGEIVGQYLRRGSRVLVEGRLQTRSWDAQDGSKKNRTEIVAENVIMLDSKGSSGSAMNSSPRQTKATASEGDTMNVIEVEETAPSQTAQTKVAADEEEISVEDIPF